jgi:hypothetical protein
VAGARVLVVVPGRGGGGTEALDVLVLNVLVLVVLVLIVVGGLAVVLVRRVVLGLGPGGGLFPPPPSPFCVGVVS